MKTNWRPFGVVCLMITVLLWPATARLVQADAGGPARMLNVGARVDGNSVRIEAKASGEFEYTTYRPSGNLFVVDLAGVSAATASSAARVLKSDVVSSYRVLQYRSGDRAIVRIEVLMRQPVEPRVVREGDSLVLSFGDAPAAPMMAAAPARPEPIKTEPARKPAPAAKSAPASVISKVAVTRAPQGTQVVVSGDGRLVYQTMRLSAPERVVLDFWGTKPTMAAKTAPAAVVEPVRGVRVGQFKPGVTRVVIDLETVASYEVTPQDNSVVVSFGVLAAAQLPAAPVPETPAPLVMAEPETKTAETPVNNTPVVSGPAMPAPVRENAPSRGTAAEPPVVKQQEMAQPVYLPVSLTQKSVGLAAPAAIEPKPAAPAPPPSQPAAAPASVVPAGAQKYTGEPISVNLKDVDLKDFFRLIHEISGLNIVVDPNVKGTLTLVLDDVPWDQALDIVLKNNGLDKQLEGNVLRIATRDTLKKEAEVRRDLVKAQAEAVDTIVRTKVLSYAKATSVRDTLKRFLSSRGEILADERSNTLIIRDIPSVFPDIESLIGQLDRRTQQVEIEARVVAATRTFARDIGTQFGFATSAAGGRTVFGGVSAVGNSPISRGSGVPQPPLIGAGSSIPFNTNLANPSPTSGVAFAHASPNLALDFIITAAESKGVGKLLSKPRVITQNNEKATVKQGNRIPIQTVVNNTISTQFIDAVLKLEVTPQITAEGTIFMEVLVENTAIDAGVPRVQGIPALRTQSAETKVLIGDGGTVVIGGVIISSQRTDVSQVPLFGSIPLIGHLFRRTQVSTDSQELLFFLTPRIVPN
jgi:type IV pilus assembly protein PilQ